MEETKKRRHPVLKAIGIIFLVLAVALVMTLIRNGKRSAEDQEAMVKTDEELIGTHFYVPRDGKDAVDVNLYLPDSAESTPVVFNLHGGAFIAGDADTLDTQSDRISKEWGMAVVAVNYKLAKDGITIGYVVDEVVDTVLYFQEHAEEYNIDPDKVVIVGQNGRHEHSLV